MTKYLLVLLISALTSAAFAVPATNAARAQARWNAWVAGRNPACAPAFDSVASFAPNSRKVAVLLHGVASNPRALLNLKSLFESEGYSVLVPRLRGHFDRPITNLDRATADEWVQDSEQVFAIARLMGPQVTLVGFSLGGTLASRLALKYPNNVDQLILFAPAWRVDGTVSLGSMLGTIAHLSLNDYQHTVAACRLNHGYLPGSAGHEVENLIINTEQEFGSSYSPGRPTASIFARIRVPHIVFTSVADEAIDRGAVSSICAWQDGLCTEINLPNTHHYGLEQDPSLTADGRFAGQTVDSIIHRFLALRGK